MIRFLTWQRVPASAMRFIDLARETRVVVRFAVAYVVAAALTGVVQRAWPAPLWGATSLTADLTYLIGFKLALLLIVPTIAVMRAGYQLDDLLLGWRATPRRLLSLAVAFLLGAAINASYLEPIRAAYASLPPLEALARTGTGAILMLFAAAIPEEVVFRWGLQTRLEQQWGRTAGILVASLLFAAWHLPTRFLLARGVEGTAGDLHSVLLATGVPVFISGLLFGLAWSRWRNLPVLIAVHWGIDLLPAIASLLQVAPTPR